MAITLDTAVEAYIDRVRDSLKTGTNLNPNDSQLRDPVTEGLVSHGSNMFAAAQNYLFAQDAATVLELLQEAMGATGLTTGTAVGQTVSVVTTSGISNLAAGHYVGFKLVFADDTATAALQGVERKIASHDTSDFTLAEELPAAAGDSDEFSLVPDDEFVDAMRQGVGLADAPRGNPYGEYRHTVGGYQRFIETVGGTLPSRDNGFVYPDGVRAPAQPHPAPQPGDNLYWASVIEYTKELVKGLTVPS